MDNKKFWFEDEEDEDDGPYVMESALHAVDADASIEKVADAYTILENMIASRSNPVQITQAKTNYAMAMSGYFGSTISEAMQLIESDDEEDDPPHIAQAKENARKFSELLKTRPNAAAHEREAWQKKLENYDTVIGNHYSDKAATKKPEEKKPEPPKQESKPEEKKPEFKPATVTSGQAQMGGKPHAVPPPAATKPQGQPQQQQGQNNNQQKSQQPSGRRDSLGMHLATKALEKHKKKGFLTRLLTRGKVKAKAKGIMKRMEDRVSKSNKNLDAKDRSIAAHSREEKQHRDTMKFHDEKTKGIGAKVLPWYRKAHERDRDDAKRKMERAAGGRLNAEREKGEQRGKQTRFAGEKEEMRRRFRGAGIHASYEHDMMYARALAEEINERKGLDLDEGALNDLAWKIGNKIAPDTTRRRAKRLANQYRMASKQKYQGGWKAGREAAHANRAKANEYLTRSMKAPSGKSIVDKAVRGLGLSKDPGPNAFIDRRKYNKPPKRKQAAMGGSGNDDGWRDVMHKGKPVRDLEGNPIQSRRDSETGRMMGRSKK